ncbi:hypothetical protein E2C01_062878 [Portunus trituberculatus]|uniref:Uncharacterized protein n=1 Tax=Portunus trituberculatus TaxID=210409 RepID=A0A5B7HGN1_PORTR|nr:hypothetical protein [Portunus trituberculatus]
MAGLAGRGDITRQEARRGDSEGLLPGWVCVVRPAPSLVYELHSTPRSAHRTGSAQPRRRWAE